MTIILLTIKHAGIIGHITFLLFVVRVILLSVLERSSVQDVNSFAYKRENAKYNREWVLSMEV